MEWRKKMNQQTKKWEGTTKELTNKQSNRQMTGDGQTVWIAIAFLENGTAQIRLTSYNNNVYFKSLSYTNVNFKLEMNAQQNKIFWIVRWIKYLIWQGVSWSNFTWSKLSFFTWSKASFSLDQIFLRLFTWSNFFETFHLIEWPNLA